MTPALLQALVTLSESGNFMEAARKLGVSQAALSRWMKMLEAECPAALFALQGKKKVLTAYGLELAAKSRAGFQAIENSVLDLNRRHLEPERLVLRIAGRPEVCAYVIRKAKLPGRLEIHPRSTQEAVKGLRARELDLAFVHERPDSHEFVSRKLFRSYTKLVVHKRWLKGRANEPYLQSEFLRETPALAYQSDDALFRELCTHIKLDFGAIRFKAVCESWEALMGFVSAGLGYALVPSYAESRDRDLLEFPIPENICQAPQYHVVFPKEILRIPALAGALRELEKTLA